MSEQAKDQSAGGFRSWAIVELFGHTTLAGEVSEAAIGGCNFVRVDVPEVGENAAYTRFLGQGAIYSITPVDREIAIQTAQRLKARPVQAFGILPSSQPALEFDPGVDDERIALVMNHLTHHGVRSH